MIDRGLMSNCYALILCAVKGYSSDRALTEMGISPNVVVGIKSNGRPHTLIDVNKAVRLYNQGYTLTEVSSKMNISMKTLLNNFKDIGFKTRGRGKDKSKKIKELNI